MSTAHPRIAIIGGGPSGLVLLLTLHRRGIPATIYERDVTPYSRSHLGGTLDLRWDSGQRALLENGLEEAFKANSRPEGDFYRITDKHANVLLETPEDTVFIQEEIRPEIDRSALRRILLDAVPAESVKWNHALSSVRSLDNGEHEFTFANGTTVTCDILVGADGAHSRVRSLVSPAKAEFTGITGAEISLPPEVAARSHMADVRELIGHGSLFAFHDGKMFAAQRNTDGRVRTYAFFQAPEDWSPPAEPSEARRVIRAEFEDWAPILLKLVDHCDDAAIYRRPLYQLPVGHRWAHVDGVTLIGDAAHLFTQAAGMGANLALLDGLECGLVLAEAVNAGLSREDGEVAVAKWETEKMLKEGEKWAQITARNLGIMHGPDTPAAVVVLLKDQLRLEPPRKKQ